MQMRQGAPARVPVVNRNPAVGQRRAPRRLTTADVKKYKNAEPWTYYDTRLISAGIVPPDSVAFNFAQWTNPQSFFDTRTRSKGGYALSNMNDNFKMDADFLCKTISVDVFCDQDATSAAAESTAAAFGECIVNAGILQFDFGTTTKLVLPVIKCPSGGGVVSTVKTTAAARDAANVNNGLQSGSSKRPLDEQMLFRKGTTFSCELIVDEKPAATSTVARINALTALSGTQHAGVRVNLEGIRGTPLLEATPAE